MAVVVVVVVVVAVVVATGEYPLHWCVNWRLTRAISLLLSHHCDANIKDSSGASPMHWALISLIYGSNPVDGEIIQMLVKYGYNTDVSCLMMIMVYLFIHSFIHPFISGMHH